LNEERLRVEAEDRKRKELEKRSFQK